MITLPYIKGTTDNLANIFKKRGFTVAFAPHNSIMKFVDSVKDALDQRQQKGVYEVPCSYEKFYIGEMGRSLKTRLKEHSTDIFHGRTNKSVLAEHSHITSHHVCIEKSSLIAKEDNYNKRRIREVVEIEKKRNNNLNKDDGLKLSNTWKPLINKIKRNCKGQVSNCFTFPQPYIYGLEGSFILQCFLSF